MTTDIPLSKFEELPFANILEGIYLKFEIEKEAKSEAYAFIISHGLLAEFTKYCLTNRSENNYAECMNMIKNNCARMKLNPDISNYRKNNSSCVRIRLRNSL